MSSSSAQGSPSAQPKPKSNGGRKKVVIKKMENESNLLVTFAKRRPVAMKKASELVTLCGAEVALIIQCPRGKKIYSFGHPSVKEVFDKYVYEVEAPTPGPLDRMVADQRNSKMRELNLQLTHAKNVLAQEKKKAEELDFIKLQGQVEKWYPPALEELSKEELLEYKERLEKFQKLMNEKAKEASVHGTNQGSIPTDAPPVLQNGVNIHGATPFSMFRSAVEAFTHRDALGPVNIPDPTAPSSNPILTIPIRYNNVGNIYGVAGGSIFNSNPCFQPPFQNNGGNFFGAATTSSFSFAHGNQISVPRSFAPPLQDDVQIASNHGEAGMISNDQNSYTWPFSFDLVNSFAGFSGPGQQETTNNTMNDISAQIEPYGEDLTFNLEEFGDLFSELIDSLNLSGETSSTLPIAGTNSSWPSQNPLPPTPNVMIPWTTAMNPEAGLNEGTGGLGAYNGFNNEGDGGLGTHTGFNNERAGGLGTHTGVNNEGTGVLGPYIGFNIEETGGFGFNNEGTVGLDSYNGFNNEGIDGLGPNNGFNDVNINDTSTWLNNSTIVYGSFTGFSDGTSGLGLTNGLNNEIGGLDPFAGLNDDLSDLYGGFNNDIDGSGAYGGFNDDTSALGPDLGFNDGIAGSGINPDFYDGLDGLDPSSAFNDGAGGSIF